MRWVSNDVLLEWDQSITWCDAERQRSYERLLKRMQRVAVRAIPLGAVLFAAAFWLIGRIPGGGGPIPYRWQLKFAGPWLLFLLLPYVALRLRPATLGRGTSVHVRLHISGIQFVEANRTIKQFGWSSFDAFDLGSWNGFDVLKLRFRGSWFSQRFGHRIVAAVEFGTAQVHPSSIRQMLQDRGLYEEPLGEPG